MFLREGRVLEKKQKDHYYSISLPDLVRLCQQDDKFALETLIKRNEKIVYNTLYHLDPNRPDLSDLTQEVLFRMTRSIKKLRNPDTFKYWLNQIITNLFYDELRRKTRKLPTVSIDEPISDQDSATVATREIPDIGQVPEETILGSELDEKIKEAIQKLPEQFRVVVVLRELQGLSYDEIAKITKTSIGTVKSRLARARGKLQDQIKPYLQ